jgi:hypothetical protein
LCKDLDIDDSTYSRSIRTANTWKPHTLWNCGLLQNQVLNGL